MEHRELTRQERSAIRGLVTRWCANHDREYGCLLLDGPCYMLGKYWTGGYCRYFRESVLPLDPGLMAVLIAKARIPALRVCPVCGQPVAPGGRRRYCSPACASAAHRNQQRHFMRRKRGYTVDK